VFLIQDITGAALSEIIMTLQLVLYTSLALMLISVAWKKTGSLLYTSLFLTPLTYLSFINDPAFAGRKEVLFILTLSIFIYLLQRGALTRQKFSVILLLITVTVLIHEAFLFYLPYFIIALYLTDTIEIRKKSAIILLAAVIPVGAIVLFGGELDQGSSISIIRDRGLILDANNAFNIVERIKPVELILNNLYDHIYYLVSMIIVLTHFMIYLYFNNIKKIPTVLLSFSICAVISVPLFIMAIDWGRWLQIHMFMLLLIVTLITPDVTEQTGKRSLKVQNLIAIAIVLIHLNWGLKHCHVGFFTKGLLG
jgi:hypothetical protein